MSPSSPDPVHRWLDIFAPMTGLPKSQQAEIRAELEDHLRARVDDLMITGLSEPDAIQKAVEELGETANLASQFRTALKPKRNTLMHAALIAIAGSALTLGILNTTGTTSPTAPLAAATTAATAAQPEQSTAISASEAAPHNANLRRYDLSPFVEPGQSIENRSEAQSIANAIEGLIAPRAQSPFKVEEDKQGESVRFVLRIVGNTMFVQATDQTHDAIGWLLTSLREDDQQQKADARRMADAAEAEREQAIESLLAEADTYGEKITEIETKLFEAESAFQETEFNRNNKLRVGGQGSQWSAQEVQEYVRETNNMLRPLKSEIAQLKIELADATAYRDSARNQLIELRYEPYVLAERARQNAAMERLNAARARSARNGRDNGNN